MENRGIDKEGEGGGKVGEERNVVPMNKKFMGLFLTAVLIKYHSLVPL